MAISGNSYLNLATKITQSRLRILANAPFYGVLLMELKYLADDKEESFSTDGKSIYFNPAYLNSLKDEELDICILHELFHIILKHPFRYKESMDNDLYHLAADIVVNSNMMQSKDHPDNELVVNGKILPHLAPNNKEGHLYTTEEVYMMLIKKYPHRLNKDMKSDESLQADPTGGQSNDNVALQIGPERKTKYFEFKPSVDGYLYFRELCFMDYVGKWKFDMNMKYIPCSSNTNSLLLTAKKIQNMTSKDTIEMKMSSSDNELPVPFLSLDESSLGFDIQTSFQNMKSYKGDFYKVWFNQATIDALNSTKHDKSLAKDELIIRKHAYKYFTSIAPIYKTFFLKFAKDRNIDVSNNDFIVACRNAIAQVGVYNLNFAKPPRGQDDLLYFMTTGKEGMCVQFATALTMLYRALGVPARYTTGYMVKGTKDKFNQAFKEDGHAWVEVYLNGTGWINVDPTPISSDNSSSSNGRSKSNSNGDNQNNDLDGNKNSKDKPSTAGLDNHSRWAKNEDDNENQLSEEEINERIIKSDKVVQESSRGCGKYPGFLQDLIDSLTKPKLDWRTILVDFIQENIIDYSFMVPDNRFQDSDFVLPSFSLKDEEIKNILFMVDCSGSMSNDDIKDCFSEIQGALDQFNGKLEGYVAFFDTMVYKLHKIDGNTNILDLKPVGRGGTNFDAIFNYVKTKMIDNLPASIIILSDGYAPYPNENNALGIPTMWVINNNGATPPWGRVLRLIKTNNK